MFWSVFFELLGQAGPFPNMDRLTSTPLIWSDYSKHADAKPEAEDVCSLLHILIWFSEDISSHALRIVPTPCLSLRFTIDMTVVAEVEDTLTYMLDIIFYSLPCIYATQKKNKV